MSKTARGLNNILTSNCVNFIKAIETLREMSGTIRHRTLREIEKRALSKLTKHSHTLFLFIVAVSSVLLFSTTRMLRNAEHHFQHNIEVLSKRTDQRRNFLPQVGGVGFACHIFTHPIF